MGVLQLQRRGPRRAAGRRARRPLFLEALEKRVLLVSTLSVGNASFNLAAGAAGFTVTRSGDLTPVVDVGYAVTDGTATSGTNYTSTAPTGTLQFASGQTTATIPLTILSNNFLQSTRDFHRRPDRRGRHLRAAGHLRRPADLRHRRHQVPFR